MYYIMITASAALFSLQFLFNNNYQREEGSSWTSSLKFSLYSSFAGMVVLFFINKFRMEVTLFSLLTAFLYSIVNVALGYSSIKAFKYANLSVYSVFSMIGGMLLPFIYGILCGEEFKIIRLACCMLIVIAVVMSVNGGSQSKKAIKYYISVFILNGMVGVISKFHQSYTMLCVDSSSFMILTKILTVILSIALLLLEKEKNFTVSKKAVVYCAGHSVLNSIGNLMLLLALLHLPASVQYPIVTGGVIAFSTVVDKIRKEKVTKKELAAACVAFIAAALMAF